MSLKLYFVLCCIQVAFCKTPNIVVFLTDDQDILLGGLTPMKQTLEMIANEGTIFQNAFANTPVCCPSRSTILSGRYQHNTKVLNNSVEGGCAGENWRNNIEPYSVASLLNQAGYNTFYAGKYLNRYGNKNAGGVEHIPSGWSSWYGLVGNSRYYNYTLSENGKAVHYNDVYLTDLIKEKSLEFLNNVDVKSPFFMMLGTPAPHAPFTPAPRHQGTFPNIKALRTPAFNYTPTDKHWLLRMSLASLPEDVTSLDKVQQLRFESLLAVDELVEAVLKKIESLDELNNTFVIYTSDHGYHIGQFCQAIDKRQPYDTDIAIPLIIRGPNIRKKFVATRAVSAVDLAPTILDFAGVKIPSYMDGESFANSEISVAKNIMTDQKNTILVEYSGEGNQNTNDESCGWENSPDLMYCSAEFWCKCEDSKNNTYTCLRQLQSDSNVLYCEFLDSENFREFYNMKSDRYQLKNIYKYMKPSERDYFSDMTKKFVKCSGSGCRNL